jgi:hypothetical protein
VIGGTGANGIASVILPQSNNVTGASMDLRARTDSLALPVGTNAERPGTAAGTSAAAGMIRFNVTSTSFEGYNGSTWGALGGGGGGSGATSIADGTAAAPGLAFASDTDTGLYRPGADSLGFATAGVSQMSLSGTTAANGILTVPPRVSQTGVTANTTIFGNGAGNATMWGQFNTAFGSPALPANTSGEKNTAIGASALNNNTTGSQNTAVGAPVHLPRQAESGMEIWGRPLRAIAKRSVM